MTFRLQDSWLAEILRESCMSWNPIYLHVFTTLSTTVVVGMCNFCRIFCLFVFNHNPTALVWNYKVTWMHAQVVTLQVHKIRKGYFLFAYSRFDQKVAFRLLVKSWHFKCPRLGTTFTHLCTLHWNWLGTPYADIVCMVKEHAWTLLVHNMPTTSPLAWALVCYQQLCTSALEYKI